MREFNVLGFQTLKITGSPFLELSRPCNGSGTIGVKF
jgi:hypothetical protein